MLYSSSITSKGQATIPLEVRRYLGLEKGDTVIFSLVGDTVQVIPKKTFQSLKGSVRVKQKLSDTDWDAAVIRWYKKQKQ